MHRLTLTSCCPALYMILLLLGLTLTAPLSGQRFIGAVAAGANLSQIDGDRLGGYHRIGLNAGARVNAILSERWQLGMELTYSQLGSDRALYDDPNSGFDNIRVNVVEVPVQLSFVEWKFHVNAGLSYHRVVSTKVIDASGADATELIPFNDNGLNMVFGVIYWGGEHIGYHLRWSRSISNMRAKSEQGTFTSRAIMLRLMYQF